MFNRSTKEKKEKMRSEGNKIELYNGDCLIESDKIENGTVDLILTDLPYGTIKGQGKSPAAKQWGYKNSEWDEEIPPKKIYEIANRILRKNGKMILFAQEPYTSKLITDAITNVPFLFKMIWKKDNYGSHLKCNKAPLGYFEEILVFGKIYDTELNHPLCFYGDKVLSFIGKKRKDILIEMKNEGAFHFLLGSSSHQFYLCTEKTYLQLIQMYELNKMEGFIEYSELRKAQTDFYNKNSSTFNLWEGNRYKSNILEYKKDYDNYHPTQKPLLLLEDLIKTFSNENDLVVDLTMGSGSTGVACVNTNRRFTGIEMSEQYFNIAQKRIYGTEFKPNGFEKTEERGLFLF